MKNWNIHSAWVIGILLALLVGTTAVDWNQIEGLAEIINFAVGLSSLILAVIAIFQSLSSAGSVASSLSAVKEASEGALQTNADLQGSIASITIASSEARSAATAALEATQDFARATSSVLASSEAGRVAIAELREDMKGKQALPEQVVSGSADTEPVGFKNVTVGGAALIYALIRGYESKRSFTFKDIFPDDISLIWESGYLSALGNVGLVGFKKDGDTFEITSLSERIKDADDFRSRKFSTTSARDLHSKRVSQVDAFFGPRVSATAA